MFLREVRPMNELEAADEKAFVERHGHVNEIAVGTVLEYDDWQWALVTEVASDREEPMFGFILLDEVGDHIIKDLVSAVGCREHYEVVKHLRGGMHEYWTPVDYVVSDEVWAVLGPIHPDYREAEHG